MLKCHTNIAILVTLLNFVIAQNSSTSPSSASDSDSDNNNQTQSIHDWHNPQSSPVIIVVGIVAILFGVAFFSIGKYIEKFLKSVAGFFSLGLLIIGISSFIVDLNNLKSSQYTGILISSLLNGILGGILAWRSERFGRIIFGILFGISVGQLITRFSFVKDINIHLCIVIAFGILGSFISVLPIKHYILIGTCFIGTQLLMSGIDLLTNLGYLQFVDKDRDIIPSPAVWGMMASSIALTIIGILFQLYVLPDRTKSANSSTNSFV